MKKNKILPLLLAVCLFMTGCGNTKDTLAAQQELKRQGMELQLAGDYEGAIAKYVEAMQLSDMKVGPEEIDLAYYKASAQYQSGDLTGAIQTYSAILALKEEAGSYFGRGILYMEMQNLELSQADLEKVSNEKKDLLIVGLLNQAGQQYAEAKKCFERAAEEGNPEALLCLANVYEETGDHNYAIELLRQYAAEAAVSAEGCLSAGGYFFEDGLYQEALEILQKGIALGESGVYKKLLQEEIACWERLGDFAKARELAAAYLESYPEDPVIQREYEFLRSR